MPSQPSSYAYTTIEEMVTNPQSFSANLTLLNKNLKKWKPIVDRICLRSSNRRLNPPVFMILP
jgi:hypothetical protein